MEAVAANLEAAGIMVETVPIGFDAYVNWLADNGLADSNQNRAAFAALQG